MIHLNSLSNKEHSLSTMVHNHVQNQYGENQVKWEAWVLKEKRRWVLLGAEKIRRWSVPPKCLDRHQGNRRGKRAGETYESTKTMDPDKENNRFSRKDQQTLIRAHPIICCHQHLQFQIKYYGFVWFLNITQIILFPSFVFSFFPSFRDIKYFSLPVIIFLIQQFWCKSCFN